MGFLGGSIGEESAMLTCKYCPAYRSTSARDIPLFLAAAGTYHRCKLELKLKHLKRKVQDESWKVWLESSQKTHSTRLYRKSDVFNSSVRRRVSYCLAVYTYIYRCFSNSQASRMSSTESLAETSSLHKLVPDSY